MLIIGIDPSTNKAGIASVELGVGDTRLLRHELLRRHRKATTPDFLNQIREKVIEYSKGADEIVVTVEAAHIRSHHDEEKGRQVFFANAHAALNQCIGAVSAAAAEVGARFYHIRPSEWRRCVTGCGDAGYGFVRTCLTTQLGAIRSSAADDELAAIAIALTSARIEETKTRIQAAENRDKSSRRSASPVALGGKGSIDNHRKEVIYARKM